MLLLVEPQVKSLSEALRAAVHQVSAPEPQAPVPSLPASSPQ
jgi:hypothetical protein